MRIGDWSSDVGSADLDKARGALQAAIAKHPSYATAHENLGDIYAALAGAAYSKAATLDTADQAVRRKLAVINQLDTGRSEEHTSELQSLMRNSYAVFCLKKKNITCQHSCIMPV